MGGTTPQPGLLSDTSLLLLFKPKPPLGPWRQTWVVGSLDLFVSLSTMAALIIILFSTFHYYMFL